MAEHSLVKYEEQENSFSPYRHYCECTCGFQCRLSTEEAAKSQFDQHLRAHGATPVAVKEEKEWKPFL